MAGIFGVLPTVGYHVLDVQPGLFADSTAGTSVSRSAPGSTTGRAAPASCTSDPAATAMARTASDFSRMLGHKWVQSESLGSELAVPALPLHPHGHPLASDWQGADINGNRYRETVGRAGLEPATSGLANPSSGRLLSSPNSAVAQWNQAALRTC